MRKHLKIIKKSSSYRQMVILDILEKKNMKNACILFIKKIRKSAIRSLLSFGGTWLLFYTSSSSSFPG